MTTTPARRLYVSMITSLDGYIEDRDRKLDWFQDGNPQFERYCDEMIDSVGLAVYGRTSYDLMNQYWPQAEGAFAAKMNALPKLVLSRTLERATWANTRIARDVDAIAAEKRTPGKPIVAWAGPSLVASLADAGLVDEYRLVVHPLALAGGTPLFRTRTKLRQIRTQTLDGGISVICYEPLR
jgi:dihydrofolate reductase